MDLDLVKIIGVPNEAVYSYLKRSANSDNFVVVDLVEMSKLFSMKQEHISSCISILSFLGLFRKTGKNTYLIFDTIKENNLNLGEFVDGSFVISGYDSEAFLLRSIIDRCCKNKTYADVCWSENFSDIDYFRVWCNNQIGYKNRDAANTVWHIEKDLLSGYDSRIYSENTCVFLPQEINLTIGRRGSSVDNGLPTGVAFRNKPHTFCSPSKKVVEKYILSGQVESGDAKHYSACINIRGVSHHLGEFYTKECAGEAYRYAKRTYLTEVAEKWKDEIDPRAYQALLNFDLDKLKRKVT